LSGNTFQVTSVFGSMPSLASPEFAVHRHGNYNTLIRFTFLPKKTAS
jgi:hypothetical protein